MMKKFIFIFSFLMLCQDYGKAMTPQSNFILTNQIFLHPEKIIAQNNLDKIQGAMDIIEQYQELQNIHIQSQSQALKNKLEALEKIEAVSKQAQEQPMGVKYFDPLFNDQNLLSLVQTPIGIQTMQYLLASQKYLLYHDTLSFEEKNQILHQLWTLLPYQIPLINDLRKYNLRNLDDMAALLPTFYDKVWNGHKFMITSGLLNTLKDAELDYADNLVKLNNLKEFDQQLTHTKNQYQQAKDSIKSLRKLQEKRLQKKSLKKTAREPQIHVHELSKKEKAALLAAEQRAEQSKKDKERHAALLKEQEDIATKQTPAAILAATEVKKYSNPSSAKPKNKNKLSKPIVDEEHDYLDSILAQIPPVQNDNVPSSTITPQKKLTDYIQELDALIAKEQARDLERKKRIEQSKMQETSDVKESV